MTTEAGPHELITALTRLRDTIAASRYPLALPAAHLAASSCVESAAQLDDYLIPRLRRLDAPLLAVVGGPTGAGKSTIVNSMVRAPVSPAGVLRPTTRTPVVVCNPVDGPWFSGPNRQVVSALALARGVALLDSPDIDSVVDTNRATALRLMASADLWLFVTTAARYADAVPWEQLRTARNRGVALAIVLNRIPHGSADPVAAHLASMLADQDLIDVPMFLVPESRRDGQGLLDEYHVAPLLEWLTALARSPETRAAVVRQTVGGAIDAVEPVVAGLAAAADEQVAAARALASSVRAAYRAAEMSVTRGVREGALLRGEVLARWQDLVGTGDVAMALRSRIGQWLDRAATATGRVSRADRFQQALELGIVSLLRAAATDAAEQTSAAWRAHPAGAALLHGDSYLGGPGPDLTQRVRRLVRDWERRLTELTEATADSTAPGLPAGPVSPAPGLPAGSGFTSAAGPTPGRSGPTPGWAEPTAGWATTPSGRPEPTTGWAGPTSGWGGPTSGWATTPTSGWATTASGPLHPMSPVSPAPAGQPDAPVSPAAPAGRGGRLPLGGLGRVFTSRTGAGRRPQRASAHAVKATGPLVAALVFTATAVDTTDPGFLTFPAYLVDRSAPGPGSGSPGARANIVTSGAANAATSAARRVLGAVFGARAVDGLAAQARADLLTRVAALLAEESSRYVAALEAAGVDESTGERLREAGREVTIARMRAGLPAARTAQVRLPTPRSAPPAGGIRPTFHGPHPTPGARQ